MPSVIKSKQLENTVAAVQHSADSVVSYWQAVRFFIWALTLIFVQAWRDLRGLLWFEAVLATDKVTHYLYLPLGRKDPRIIGSGPFNLLTAHIIPGKGSSRYEDVKGFGSTGSRQIINFASTNYGGFAESESGQMQVLQKAVQQLSFSPSTAKLELRVRNACCKFTGSESCIITRSGFGANISAFALVAKRAKAQGRVCVFLCDSDCHASMFTGAYINKDAKTTKFRHNDMDDLQKKLQKLAETDPKALVCVAIEGLYSQEGSVPNLPKLLAMRKLFGFTLLMDEAHSFLAIGSDGRGCVNYWQDKGYSISVDEVDLIVCVLSKSFPCMGGTVFANSLYRSELVQADGQTSKLESPRLAAPVLIRVLGILAKPALIKKRMLALKARSSYMAEFLRSRGVEVTSTEESPVICFTAGTSRQAVEFHAQVFQNGAAVTCAVPPATTLWKCRVRMCVSATHKWDDIHRGLDIIVDGHRKLDLPRRIATGHPLKLPTKDHDDESSLRQDGVAADEKMNNLIDDLSDGKTVLSSAMSSTEIDQVKESGRVAIERYGIGPCSARMYYGSMDSMMQLEQDLSKIYPSLVQQAGHTRAMIYGDTESGVRSVMTACAVPHHSDRVQHYILVDQNARDAVLQGINYSRAHPKVTVKNYGSTEDIEGLIHQIDRRQRFYLTIYLRAIIGEDLLDMSRLLAQLKLATAKRDLKGITFIIDDQTGIGSLGPAKLGYLNFMESLHGKDFLRKATQGLSPSLRFLITGQLQFFDSAAGYTLGTGDAVELLTWNTKAYFFSTPPLPYQTVMASQALQIMSSRRGSAYEGKKGEY